MQAVPIDEALGMFPVVTRGPETPAANPRRPLKNWSEDADGPKSYRHIVDVRPSGEPVWAEFLVDTPREINLPGKRIWPKYEPDLSGFTRIYAGTGYSALLPLNHTSRAEAEALRAEMVAGLGDTPRTALTELDPASLGGTRYEQSADRKLYLIGDAYAGWLLKHRHAAGLNHPGKWSDSGSGGSGYKFTPTQDHDTTGPGSVPMPHHDLPPGARVQGNMFGVLTVVMGELGGTVPVGVDIEARLARIEALVNEIAVLARVEAHNRQ